MDAKGHSQADWDENKQDIWKFLEKLRAYHKETNREKREELSSPLLDWVEHFRCMDFFTYSETSIKLLKIELEKCQVDNKKLAEELMWYHKSDAQSVQGVSPNAD